MGVDNWKFECKRETVQEQIFSQQLEQIQKMALAWEPE